MEILIFPGSLLAGYIFLRAACWLVNAVVERIERRGYTPEHWNALQAHLTAKKQAKARRVNLTERR